MSQQNFRFPSEYNPVQQQQALIHQQPYPPQSQQQAARQAPLSRTSSQEQSADEKQPQFAYAPNQQFYQFDAEGMSVQQHQQQQQRIMYPFPPAPVGPGGPGGPRPAYQQHPQSRPFYMNSAAGMNGGYNRGPVTEMTLPPGMKMEVMSGHTYPMAGYPGYPGTAFSAPMMMNNGIQHHPQVSQQQNMVGGAANMRQMRPQMGGASVSGPTNQQTGGGIYASGGAPTPGSTANQQQAWATSTGGGGPVSNHNGGPAHHHHPGMVGAGPQNGNGGPGQPVPVVVSGNGPGVSMAGHMNPHMATSKPDYNRNIPNWNAPYFMNQQFVPNFQQVGYCPPVSIHQQYANYQAQVVSAGMGGMTGIPQPQQMDHHNMQLATAVAAGGSQGGAPQAVATSMATPVSGSLGGTLGRKKCILEIVNPDTLEKVKLDSPEGGAAVLPVAETFGAMGSVPSDGGVEMADGADSNTMFGANSVDGVAGQFDNNSSRPSSSQSANASSSFDPQLGPPDYARTDSVRRSSEGAPQSADGSTRLIRNDVGESIGSSVDGPIPPVQSSLDPRAKDFQNQQTNREQLVKNEAYLKFCSDFQTQLKTKDEAEAANQKNATAAVPVENYVEISDLGPPLKSTDVSPPIPAQDPTIPPVMDAAPLQHPPMTADVASFTPGAKHPPLPANVAVNNPPGIPPTYGVPTAAAAYPPLAPSSAADGSTVPPMTPGVEVGGVPGVGGAPYGTIPSRGQAYSMPPAGVPVAHGNVGVGVPTPLPVGGLQEGYGGGAGVSHLAFTTPRAYAPTAPAGGIEIGGSAAAGFRDSSSVPPGLGVHPPGLNPVQSQGFGEDSAALPKVKPTNVQSGKDLVKSVTSTANSRIAFGDFDDLNSSCTAGDSPVEDVISVAAETTEQGIDSRPGKKTSVDEDGSKDRTVVQPANISDLIDTTKPPPSVDIPDVVGTDIDDANTEPSEQKATENPSQPPAPPVIEVNGEPTEVGEGAPSETEAKEEGSISGREDGEVESGEDDEEEEEDDQEEENQAEKTEEEKLSEISNKLGDEWVTAMNNRKLETPNTEEDTTGGFRYDREVILLIKDLQISREHPKCYKSPQLPEELFKERKSMMIEQRPMASRQQLGDMRTDMNRAPGQFSPNWFEGNKPAPGVFPRRKVPYSGSRGGSMDNRQQSHGGGGGSRHSSKRSNYGRPPPVDVKLRTADNAWMPGMKKKDVDANANEVAFAAIRALLNKITPSNFDELSIEFFTYIPPDENDENSDVVKEIVEILFSKAVEEPNFCKIYARLCEYTCNRQLSMNKANRSTFRNKLLSKCQHEFEMDKAVDDKILAEEKKIAEASEAQRRQLQDDLDQMVMKEKRRTLGNMRFIGELFKQKLLIPKIVLACIHALSLKSPDEESLECLCKLLVTVGRPLHDSNINQTEYVNTVLSDLMQTAKKPGVIASRIKFMIEDVVEMKDNGWVPRRADAGPKTIQQIHEDIRKEDLNTAVKLAEFDAQRNQYRNQPPNYTGAGGGSRSRQGPNRGALPNRNSYDNNDRRNQQKNQDRQMATNMSQTMTKTTGQSLSKHINKDDATLGLRPSWGGGGAKKGYQANRNPYGASSRESSAKRDEIKDISSTLHAITGQSQPPQHRGGGGWSGGPPSRVTPNEPSTLVAPNSETVPKPEAESLTEEKIHRLRRVIDSVVNEYNVTNDIEESILSITEHVTHLKHLVQFGVEYVVEHSTQLQDCLGTVISKLPEDTCPINLVVDGICEGWQTGMDCELWVDIPKYFEYLGRIVAHMLAENRSIDIQKEYGRQMELIEDAKHKKQFLDGVFKTLNDKDSAMAQAIWDRNRESISKFLGSNLDAFLTENKLGNDGDASSAPPTNPDNDASTGATSSAAIPAKGSLAYILAQYKIRLVAEQRAADNPSGRPRPDCIFEFFDELSSEFHEDPKLISALFSSLLKCAIVNKPPDNPLLDEDILRSYLAVLHRYVTSKTRLEMEVLNCAASEDKALSHPTGLLLSIFEFLLATKVIPKETMVEWCHENERAQGMGMILKNVDFKQFYRELLNNSSSNGNSVINATSAAHDRNSNSDDYYNNTVISKKENSDRNNDDNGDQTSKRNFDGHEAAAATDDNSNSAEVNSKLQGNDSSEIVDSDHLKEG